MYKGLTSLVLLVVLSAGVFVSGAYHKSGLRMKESPELSHLPGHCHFKGSILQNELNPNDVSSYAAYIFWCEYSECPEEIRNEYCSGLDSQMGKIIRDLVRKNYKTYMEVKGHIRF